MPILFYFLFIFSILVMINFVTKILLFVVVESVNTIDKPPVTNLDKLYLAIAISYFVTYIKFF
jgi:hypothetical protein